MHNSFVFSVGGVLSADIAVPEHERELAFYSSVLTTGENPLWSKDLMNNLGTPIIGLGKQMPEYSDLPTRWMPHFQVADVARSVQIAIELGGKEIMHGKTDEGISQWAVLADQAGATFGVIPVVPKESSPPGQNERQGRIAWLSLIAPDIHQSSSFYQQVIGFTPKSVSTDKCQMLTSDKIPIADICQSNEDLNQIPSVWLIHLPVDDLGASLRLAAEGGGRIVKELHQENYVVVQDLVGVHFALRQG